MSFEDEYMRRVQALSNDVLAMSEAMDRVSNLLDRESAEIVIIQAKQTQATLDQFCVDFPAAMIDHVTRDWIETAAGLIYSNIQLSDAIVSGRITIVK